MMSLIQTGINYDWLAYDTLQIVIETLHLLELFRCRCIIEYRIGSLKSRINRSLLAINLEKGQALMNILSYFFFGKL